jgi:hypothetical protein
MGEFMWLATYCRKYFCMRITLDFPSRRPYLTNKLNNEFVKYG